MEKLAAFKRCVDTHAAIAAYQQQRRCLNYRYAAMRRPDKPGSHIARLQASDPAAAVELGDRGLRHFYALYLSSGAGRQLRQRRLAEQGARIHL